MGAMAPQIIGVLIVYSTVYSGDDQRKRPGLCEGNSPVTGEFPSQRASKAENVSIWWRHHDIFDSSLFNTKKLINFPHSFHWDIYTKLDSKVFHECRIPQRVVIFAFVQYVPSIMHRVRDLFCFEYNPEKKSIIAWALNRTASVCYK